MGPGIDTSACQLTTDTPVVSRAGAETEPAPSPICELDPSSPRIPSLRSPQLGFSHQQGLLSLCKVPPQTMAVAPLVSTDLFIYSIVCPPQTVRPIGQNRAPLGPSSPPSLQHSSDDKCLRRQGWSHFPTVPKPGSEEALSSEPPLSRVFRKQAMSGRVKL